jgi:hypothetical protein
VANLLSNQGFALCFRMKTAMFAATFVMVTVTQLSNAAPLKGALLAQRNDGVAAINEPCYVHDSSCEGYPVCCVTKGTCISQHSGTVSSNSVYYEGGCWSFDSSKKDYSTAPGCTQQGECLVQHLEVCKGGKTKSGFMSVVPSATLDRLMTGSCEADCPSGSYGHGSYGSGGSSGGTTSTVTTTTTIITRVSKTLHLEVADASTVTASAFELMLKMTIATMAGFGSDYSMVTLDIPTISASFALPYHVDVSSAHSLTATVVETNLDAMQATAVNDAIAMRIGTCSYSVTQGMLPGASSASACQAGGMAALMAMLVALLQY